MKSKFEILLEKVANQPLSKENEERIKGAFEKSKKGREMIPFVLQKDNSVEQKNLAVQQSIESCLQKHDLLLTAETQMPRDYNLSVEVVSSFEWLFDLMGSQLVYDIVVQDAKIGQWIESLPEYKGFKKLRHKVNKSSQKVAAIATNVLLLPLLAKSILGQYDLMFVNGQVGNKVLKFVQPNIESFAKSSNLAEEDLRLEVVLHEEIHARQFYNYPHLDEKRQKYLEEFMFANELATLGGCSELTKEEAKKIREESLDSIQAVMSVTEGHAVFYSHVLLKQVMPDYEAYKEQRKAYSQKRSEMFKRLSKQLEKKALQYEVGKKFVEEVHNTIGTPASKLVLSNLPQNLEELEKPELYLKRLGI